MSSLGPLGDPDGPWPSGSSDHPSTSRAASERNILRDASSHDIDRINNPFAAAHHSHDTTRRGYSDFMDPLSTESAWAAQEDNVPWTPKLPGAQIEAESVTSTPRAQQRTRSLNGSPPRSPTTSVSQSALDIDSIGVFQDADGILSSSDSLKENGSNGDDEAGDESFVYQDVRYRQGTSGPESEPSVPLSGQIEPEREAQVADENEEEDEEFHYPTTTKDDEDELQQTVASGVNGDAQIHAALAGVSADQPAPQDDRPATEPSEIVETAVHTPDGDDSPPSVPLIDFNRLHQLCVSGSLEELQAFFQTTINHPQNGNKVSTFALANEPNPTSGLAPIHYSAKEGKLEILRWLVEDMGALVEIEDREGETALHKAAMAGRLPVLTYLLNHGADADAVDADGWTALHNACSRGYLDLVRCLIETSNALTDIKGGRGAWTPLMNAASNGHLPVVRYLITKQHVDPFQRNVAGETAFDVAASSFEIFICEILEKYEAERWSALKFSASSSSQTSGSPASLGAFQPLYLHTATHVIIHQNERLDTRLSTLAVRAGKPRWSGTGASKPRKSDRRAPGTMPPGPLSISRTKEVPMRREDVHLPTRDQPYKLRLPSKSEQVARARRSQQQQQQQQQQRHFGNGSSDDLASTPTPESVLVRSRVSQGSQTPLNDDEQAEPSHFWICEWQVDKTHPQVDPVEGWQYAWSFDAPEDQWTAQPPPPLARLLEGKGLGASLTRALSGNIPGQSAAAAENEGEAAPDGWVRRRRWIRVMRRRLDIDFGDELEAAELSSLSAANSESHAAPATEATSNAARDARQDCDALGSDADYVARSKALAGPSASGGVTPADVMNEDPSVVRGRITRLDLALAELRGSAFNDDDVERRSGAEVLLKEYTLQISQLRQAIGLEEGSDEDDEDEDEDEEFIYPNSFKDTQSVITRIGAVGGGGVDSDAARPSIGQRQSSSASVFGTGIAPSSTGATNSRSADLAQAREFRVPTNETPNTVVNTSNRGLPLQQTTLMPTWERDEDARDCRGCGRKFTFFNRKHHCRRCGRIFCADCSSHRAQLTAEELVVDAAIPEMFVTESASSASRICGSCHAERQLPPNLRNFRGADQMLRDIAQDRGMSFGNINGARDDDYPRSTRTSISDVSSRASELNECPVCNLTLAQLGSQAEQEAHVRQCLDNGGGGSVQGGRYLVYRLPADSPIVSKECVICLEELLAGNAIARLPCLCFFHKNCIDSWLARGRSCPTHAR